MNSSVNPRFNTPAISKQNLHFNHACNVLIELTAVLKQPSTVLKRPYFHNLSRAVLIRPLTIFIHRHRITTNFYSHWSIAILNQPLTVLKQLDFHNLLCAVLIQPSTILIQPLTILIQPSTILIKPSTVKLKRCVSS